jgi:hypothetical protein
MSRNYVHCLGQDPSDPWFRFLVFTKGTYSQNAYPGLAYFLVNHHRQLLNLCLSDVLVYKMGIEHFISSCED